MLTEWTKQPPWHSLREGGRRVTGLPYKNEGDTGRKIQIKPLRETNVGLAQA